MLYYRLKTHKLFLREIIKYVDINVIDQIIENKFANANTIFLACFRENRINIAKWLVENKKITKYYAQYPVITTYEYAFMLACIYGYLDMAKWFIEYNERKLNIHINGDWAFISSCIHNRLDMAIWLISLEKDCGEIDIHGLFMHRFTLTKELLEIILQHGVHCDKIDSPFYKMIIMSAIEKRVQEDLDKFLYPDLINCVVQYLG